MGVCRSPHRVNIAEKNEIETMDYQVIHSIAGRLRILVSRLASDSEYANNLKCSVESIAFVTNVRVNPLAKSLIVIYDKNQLKDSLILEQIISLIRDEQRLKLITQATKKQITNLPLESRSEINYLEKLGLPVLSLVLALLATPLFELTIPAFVVGGVILLSAVPLYQKAIHSLTEERHLTVNVLESMWVTLHTLQGELTAPALSILMNESSETLREMTASESHRSHLEFVDVSRLYWVERDGNKTEVALSDLQVGDCIIVSAGDRIPVDGKAIQGTALLDQQVLTGESQLISCEVGQIVYASTLLVRGQLFILAEKVGKNTKAGQAFQLIENAPVYDSRIADYAEEISNQAVLPAMCLGAGIFAFTGDVHRAIAPLQLDFGVGIGLSVPTAILSALQYAAKTGVYIRNGRALEMLAKVDTIVFDKTGTLTEVKGEIVGIEILAPEVNAEKILSLAASAEQFLHHPFAEAISGYVTTKNIKLEACESWDYQVGMGVKAKINQQEILVGKALFLQEAGVEIDVEKLQNQEGVIRNRSLVYVAKNGKLLGYIIYSNPVRKESATVIKILEKAGINTYMLTGDRHQVASAVAYKLGMSMGRVYASATPERKIEILQQLHEQGKVIAFVGEGLNDAAALGYADVSITLTGCSDVARSTADIVLLDNDLRSLNHAINLAKRTMEIVNQNIALVAIPNISVVLAGVLFSLNPVIAVIISDGSTILAELNGLRPLFDEERKDPEIDTSAGRSDEGMLGVGWRKRGKKILSNLPI